MLPCLLFEDDHLLAVNKPAGLNTHAPSPYAGEGLYDWLRHREPRWATLAIVHRLDKETSGVILFAKTSLANRSLTAQFTGRAVKKTYLLLTDRAVPGKDLAVRSAVVRTGEKYASAPSSAGGGQLAETRFRLPRAPDPARGEMPETTSQFSSSPSHLELVTAEPLTGRTHQIRVHAAEQGFPVLGDVLYGGTPASRVYLHAAELSLRHPASGEEITLCAPLDFGVDPRLRLRSALLDPELTDAWRAIHGASDGWPGWYVERLGDYLLSQSEPALDAAQREELGRLTKTISSRGVYHKPSTRPTPHPAREESTPQPVLGLPAPDRFSIRENGLSFELSFCAGPSVGLFLDQRDNRRRLLTGHVAAGFPLFAPARPLARSEPAGPAVLNTFAYTCGFSVCAARAGARTTSLDLSKAHLDWGRRNFAANQIDPAAHDFIYGDVFDWLRRLARKPRRFDVVLLDPPTFSRSKQSGVFRAARDYGQLVAAALPLLKPGGVLFASTNTADWPPEDFLSILDAALRTAKRKVLQRHYVPQPPDFPISRSEPAYLKTVWLKVG